MSWGLEILKILADSGFVLAASCLISKTDDAAPFLRRDCLVYFKNPRVGPLLLILQTISSKLILQKDINLPP